MALEFRSYEEEAGSAAARKLLRREVVGVVSRPLQAPESFTYHAVKNSETVKTIVLGGKERTMFPRSVR